MLRHSSINTANCDPFLKILYLEQVGIPAVVLERGHQLRSAGAGIRLQTNAWHALEQLGVADTLRQKHIRQDRYVQDARKGSVLRQHMTGQPCWICSFQVHRNTGKYIGGAAYKENEENRGVVRNELIMALADALPKGCLFLGCNIQDVRLDEHGALVCWATSVSYGLLEAAEGELQTMMAVLQGTASSPSATAQSCAPRSWWARMVPTARWRLFVLL